MEYIMVERVAGGGRVWGIKEFGKTLLVPKLIELRVLGIKLYFVLN